MSLLISAVIIIGAAAFVAAPFFGAASAAPRERAFADAPADRNKLERQKREAYGAIKEAEFDYRMGKLSEADFTALREKYSTQALAAIGALESAAAPPPRALADQRRTTRIKYCPMCGHTVPPRANFCPACGKSLREAVA